MWKLYSRLLTIACVCLCVLTQSPPEFPDFFRFMQKKSNTVFPSYNANVQMCGKQLADVLALLCDGNYNSYKKSTQDPRPEESIINWEPTSIETPAFPFRSRTNAATVMAGGYTRTRRGIVQECCWKPCRVSEMLSYCAGGDNA